MSSVNRNIPFNPPETFFAVEQHRVQLPQHHLISSPITLDVAVGIPHVGEHALNGICRLERLARQRRNLQVMWSEDPCDNSGSESGADLLNASEPLLHERQQLIRASS